MQKNGNSYLLNQETDKDTIRLIILGISSLILIGMLIVTILQAAGGNSRDALILTLGMIPVLIAIGFIYFRRIELASALIAGSLSLLITILATIGQGIYDIGTMAFPAILIIASLVLKRNTVIYLTVLIVVCNAWLVFGAYYEVYQPFYPEQSFPRQFVITSLILLVTMIAVYILSNTVRRSLASAKKEVEERQKVEQALREAETMYRALVEQTSVVIYRDMPDENAKNIYISPQIEELTGYAPSEWDRDPFFWQSVVHPDDLTRILNEIKHYIETGEKTVSEYRLKTKDKRWIWVRDEAVVVNDDQGKPKYVHGVFIDITDKKNAELKVKQREAILSAVAKTAQLLLVSTDWRTDINKILRLLGAASGASHVYVFENHSGKDGVLLSSQKYEWAAPGIKSELDNPIYQGTRLIPVPGIEDWHKKLIDGKPFYGSQQQYPRYWEKVHTNTGLKTLLDVPVFVNGEWWGIIGFDDYVNEMPWSQSEIDALVAAAGNLGTAIERQFSDKGLRESEEKFNLAFKHTYVSNAIVRASDHRILEVNDSFCKVTGYSRDDVTGKRAGRDLNIWLYQKDRDFIINSLTNRGFVDEYKGKFRRKNGDIGTGLLYAANVMIADEICQLYSFVDISDIDQLLDELKSKNDELQAFTYTVSHDLKAPLVTISGFMGFLEQDARAGDTDKLDKDILRINEAVSKMQRLLDELLELSRIGRMMNSPDNVPFSDIVREALETVEGRLKTGQVQVEVEEDLPSVYGDKVRLVEVIQNLVDNSSKFMADQPEPRIKIGAIRTDDNAVFYVSDNGSGIAPEHFDRVFGLFNKLDNETEGTGIGLALVKRIVEVHGGRIWVESKGVGEGTTFYFTLAEQPTNEGDDGK